MYLLCTPDQPARPRAAAGRALRGLPYFGTASSSDRSAKLGKRHEGPPVRPTPQLKGHDTQPDDDGRVRLLPAQRRAGYTDGSATVGWLHPADAVTDDQDCPCGSEQPYSACHGATIPAEDHPAASLPGNYQRAPA